VQVLVLDDSDIMRDILVNHVLESGVEEDCIHQAFDEVEAIRLINANTYDLCLLDIMTDRTGGIAILQKLRKLQPRIKVIMFNNFLKAECVNDLAERETDDFVIKPLDYAQLKQTIIDNIPLNSI